jgi:hypothetical protein
VVLSVRVNPRTDKRELVIVWGNSPEEVGAGAFLRTLPDLRKAAVDLRCANLVFYTTRRGWDRLAKATGFRCRNVEWVLPIDSKVH